MRRAVLGRGLHLSLPSETHMGRGIASCQKGLYRPAKRYLGRRGSAHLFLPGYEHDRQKPFLDAEFEPLASFCNQLKRLLI
jgi:hypothetical protein